MQLYWYFLFVETVLLLYSSCDLESVLKYHMITLRGAVIVLLVPGTIFMLSTWLPSLHLPSIPGYTSVMIPSLHYNLFRASLFMTTTSILLNSGSLCLCFNLCFLRTDARHSFLYLFHTAFNHLYCNVFIKTSNVGFKTGNGIFSAM